MLAGKLASRFLNNTIPHGTVVALNAAGATPYFADDFQYIDMLGLNDREIARRNPVPLSEAGMLRPGHLKADGTSVLRRHPDFNTFGPPAGRLASSQDEDLLSDREIEASRDSVSPTMSAVFPFGQRKRKPHRFAHLGTL